MQAGLDDQQRPQTQHANNEMAEITKRQSARRWASVAAAAKYAAVGLTTFWAWINQRKVIAKRVGARRIVVDLGSIDEYIDGCPDVAPPTISAPDLGMHDDASTDAAPQEEAFSALNTIGLWAALKGQP